MTLSTLIMTLILVAIIASAVRSSVRHLKGESGRRDESSGEQEPEKKEDVEKR